MAPQRCVVADFAHVKIATFSNLEDKRQLSVPKVTGVSNFTESTWIFQVFQPEAATGDFATSNFS